jgi:NADH-quinone oxidoreductase subunit D
MQQPNKLSPFFENLNFERDDNTMVINFGPQHPSAHGQLRLVLELDGEQVVKAYPDIGYLHRGIEKMAENMTYNEFLPTTDRLDYIASTSNNYAYALAVEKLLGIEAPRRAQVIRTILLELNRIISHLFFVATHALDVGAMSVFLYAFREREFAMDLMEDYCGARLTHSAVRIGGVPLDIPAGWMAQMRNFCNTVDYELEHTYNALLEENRIWKMRLENVGVISAENALSWGCTGPMLRGSGVAYDIRKEEPYELYPELDFDVPIADTNDSYGRYRLYMAEMKESTKMIRQLILKYDGTEPQLMAHAPQYISAPKEEMMTQNYALMQHFVLVTQGMRPPKGEVYVPTESPKGELGFYIKSEGDPYAYRLKCRAPSFFHTGLLQEILVGTYIADVVTIIGSTNIVFGEVDR